MLNPDKQADDLVDQTPSLLSLRPGGARTQVIEREAPELEISAEQRRRKQ